MAFGRSTFRIKIVAMWLLLASIAGSVLFGGSGEKTTGTGNVQAPVISSETNSLLHAPPMVARPPAQQPPAGLAADAHLDKTPPRAIKGLNLVKSGWTYNCMECHKLFPARWHYDDRPLNEHKDIHLDHGNNRYCLNCHHPTNRNAFVDYDGAEIAEADVVTLCAKCHGTIYRDWKAGVHGRQNGFWQPSLGEKTKLRCIECHDPHSPKFKPMPPLAPPRYPSRAANPPVPGSAGVSPASPGSAGVSPAGAENSPQHPSTAER
jgi:hypothetical protein